MNWLDRLARNRTLQHSLFWMLSFYVLFRVFAYADDWSKTDVIYTLLFHLSLVPLVYLNTLVLIPRILQKRWYLTYLVVSAGLLAGGVLLNQFIFRYLTNWIFPGYYFISDYEFRDLFQFMLVYWAAGTLLKLSKSWFLVLEQEQRIRELEREKAQAELRALKGQLDPHFLFNSLNSIYSLALYADPQTPDAILKLSESMRYVLYDCRSSVVPLTRELEHIRNYIDLQLLRREDALDLTVTFPEISGNPMIAPLLLIPLVENAFKHARPDTSGRSWIRINLDLAADGLVFLVANSAAERKPRQQAGGVGLANLRQRLELLYPSVHELKLRPEAEAFFAALSLSGLNPD